MTPNNNDTFNHNFSFLKQLASKISRDLMQSDQKAPFKYQGGGYRPKGGYYSGDGGTQIDDEDYNNMSLCVERCGVDIVLMAASYIHIKNG